MTPVTRCGGGSDGGGSLGLGVLENVGDTDGAAVAGGVVVADGVAVADGGEAALGVGDGPGGGGFTHAVRVA